MPIGFLREQGLQIDVVERADHGVRAGEGRCQVTWSEMQPLLEQACWDTLYMVGWSTLIAVVGGLPLGILLVLTDRGGLLQNVLANKVVGQVVNIARSMPFIILMVALMSFTRAVTGTTIGREAAIVPLAIGAIPFFARLVETAVREVDHGLVEAVQAMGGNTWTVVRKVLVPRGPALADLVGAPRPSSPSSATRRWPARSARGGLGDIAIRYGYQRFETGLMWITVAILAVVISVIQFAGDLAARRLHRRGGGSGSAPRLRLLRPGRRRARRPRNPSPRTSARPPDAPAPSTLLTLPPTRRFPRTTHHGDSHTHMERHFSCVTSPRSPLPPSPPEPSPWASPPAARTRTPPPTPSGPLVVGASTVPHAEILTYVKDNLAKKAGLDLEVKEFTDYVTPNTGDRGRVRRRQLLPEPAVPRRLQQEERHRHRAGRHGAPGAARPLLEEAEDGRRAQERRHRRRPERHRQRGAGAQAPRRQRDHHPQGRRRQRRDPQGHRREPQEPRVQGAGGGPDPALPRRRRRRGDQRQLRPRGRPLARRGRPRPRSPPRTTRTATSSPSRRATRTTPGSRSWRSCSPPPRSGSSSRTSTRAPSSRPSDPASSPVPATSVRTDTYGVRCPHRVWTP